MHYDKDHDFISPRKITKFTFCFIRSFVETFTNDFKIVGKLEYCQKPVILVTLDF